MPFACMRDERWQPHLLNITGQCLNNRILLEGCMPAVHDTLHARCKSAQSTSHLLQVAGRGLNNRELDKLVSSLGRSKATWRRALLLHDWLLSIGHHPDDRLCTTLIRCLPAVYALQKGCEVMTGDVRMQWGLHWRYTVQQCMSGSIAGAPCHLFQVCGGMHVPCHSLYCGTFEFLSLSQAAQQPFMYPCSL
jgi:hypothetical protein